MANYEIWHTDDRGNRLELINMVGEFSLTMTVGDVGWWTGRLPYDIDRFYNNPRIDRRFHIYRTPEGGVPELLAVTFLRKWATTLDASDLKTMSMEAADTNEMLKRRIIAYAAGSSEAEKSGSASTAMYELVNENLLTGAASSRNIADLGVTIGEDTGDGTTIGLGSLSYTNLLSALQTVVQNAGNDVFFRMYPNTPNLFVFEVKPDQIGRDRTTSGDYGLLFGADFGNVTNAELAYMYDAEENVVYNNRGLSSDDDDAIDASIWNRREGYTSGLQRGIQVTQARRGRRMFQAEINSTPVAPFGGNGWRLGDKITVSHLGESFDCLIQSVQIQVDGRGQESITARVEALS
jgi:hypothetical protein